MSLETWFLFGGWVFAILGWLLYFNDRTRSRDYATDLVQVVCDYDLGREDLRRSLDWDEIDRRMELKEGATDR